MIQEQGNTVGSRSQVDLAYIAGFLDGDGSLMIQLKRRWNSKKNKAGHADHLFLSGFAA